ncbi:hypothetical protein DTO021D3_6615 [Paecilomyces variotii]|nr:hypothetical protein DTO032I3_6100 [Paecilomyces variotii]KAJ9276548.1 hypothetical protein DTO021D3_6615 [Paecilomyces variotii]KAJ9345073.1 hypothetical protein DTO027B6_2218 [Paecilomyces variotii]KAJ9353008.1 hypothetical protein DTO027B9_5513 [Paecilomyces variotii]KAJ9390217.1 hypothetical protein DTO032I4_1743 [Paecilomyces variotii]
MASHSQPFTTAPAAAPANQPPVLPESAGTRWAPRDPLRPGAAGEASSLWVKEAAAFGGRLLWGCAHCGSTATRFKGLRDHHSGRDGSRGMHPDHPFEDFTCCINNPNLQTPRPLIPEIREAATRAINEGRVLPYTLQRFDQFYTGPALPAYPPGLAPAGLAPSFAPTLAPAPALGPGPLLPTLPTLPDFGHLTSLNQHTPAANNFPAPSSAYSSDQAAGPAFEDFPTTSDQWPFFPEEDYPVLGEQQTGAGTEVEFGSQYYSYNPGEYEERYEEENQEGESSF